MGVKDFEQLVLSQPPVGTTFDGRTYTSFWTDGLPEFCTPDFFLRLSVATGAESFDAGHESRIGSVALRAPLANTSNRDPWPNYISHIVRTHEGLTGYTLEAAEEGRRSLTVEVRPPSPGQAVIYERLFLSVNTVARLAHVQVEGVSSYCLPNFNDFKKKERPRIASELAKDITDMLRRSDFLHGLASPYRSSHPVDYSKDNPFSDSRIRKLYAERAWLQTNI